MFLIVLCFCFFLDHQLFVSDAAPVDIIRSDDSNCNMVIPSLLSAPPAYKSSILHLKKAPTFGLTNKFATYVIVVITLLNVIVYKLRQSHEEEYRSRSIHSSSSFKQWRLFSIKEIRLATHDFDEDLVLGRGGFGKVYKGLLNDGVINTVAVKRLNRASRQGAKEFWTEIEMHSNFRHSHLVSLIGYCDEKEEMILVYEYMPHGTLSDHLYKNYRNGLVVSQPLSWERRLKICIGVARGLDYLHTGTGLQQRVIHRDVKSSNILLDHHWEAKVSDFGLSTIGPANQSCSHVSTNVKGTFGYIDPEYFLTHRLTRKSDVYAFGVVLFEVLCGRRAVDMRIDEEQQALARYAHRCIQEGTIDQIIDSTLRGQISKDCLKVFVEIGDQCLHYQHHIRPTMADVIAKLEFAMDLQKRTRSSADYVPFMDTGRLLEDQENNDTLEVVENLEDDIGTVVCNQEDDNGRIVGNQRNFPSSKMKDKSMLKFVAKKVFKAIFKDKKDIAKKNTDKGTSSGWKPNNLESFGSARTVSTKFSSSVPCSLSEETEIRQFSFLKIQEATNSLDAGLILSHGRQGVVFTGHLDCDETKVVIKELKLTSQKRGYESFRNEILHTKINHFHVLPLIGFCRYDVYELYLVSKYMSNGSLDYHLRNKNGTPLKWNLRLQICIGVAKGLNYLHRGIIDQIMTHGRVKPSKILLDENWMPKVSGYGLWKLETSLMSSNTYLLYDDTFSPFAGLERWAYMSPEQKAHELLTTKSDVYSMGVVLLNVLFDWRRSVKSFAYFNAQETLYDWVQMNIRERRLVSYIDSYVAGKVTSECFVEIIDIALHCLMKDKDERPSMEDVVKRLECAYDLQTHHTLNFPNNGDNQLENASKSISNKLHSKLGL